MCEDPHRKKKHNKDISGKGKVDALVDEVIIPEEREETFIVKYIGKVDMKTVDNKKYLGQILSKDLNMIRI